MAETLMEMLVRLVKRACIEDLFEFADVDPKTASKYSYYLNAKKKLPRVNTEGEKLNVDIIAFYDPKERMIVFYVYEFERALRMFKIDAPECREVFALYVLLHEFTHYIIDALGLHKWLLKLVKLKIEPDEPFCEYVALRSLATGVYRVFDFERRLCMLPKAQECLPFIASLPRPYPYNLFKDLYAIPNDIFNINAERILLSILSAHFLLDRSPVTIERHFNIPLPSLTTSSRSHSYPPLRKFYEVPCDEVYLLLLKEELRNGEPMSLFRLALLVWLSKVEIPALLIPRAPGVISPVTVTAI